MKTMILLLTFSFSAFAQDEVIQKNGEKVIVKYKQYETFDLGDLEIKGEVIAPGDLSVKERQRKIFGRTLFDRDDFNPEIREDIKNLR
ncbi:MAG: hypothetical protein Fur0010_26660 [Bdellovibrio sp.]